jgi:hypothetical protein
MEMVYDEKRTRDEDKTYNERKNNKERTLNEKMIYKEERLRIEGPIPVILLSQVCRPDHSHRSLGLYHLHYCNHLEANPILSS